MPTNKDTLISLNGVCKSFEQCGNEKRKTIDILKNINFSLKKGEIVALTGPSGTGKTTLLQIMGLLDRPTEGTIEIKSKKFVYNLKTIKQSNKRYSVIMDGLRRDYIGFVYQYHYLLPELTALENVMFPQLIIGISRSEAKAKAEKLLKEMGLEERCNHTIFKLSGGEQQRVAIARALINKPEIVIADEPTGNLDDDTATKVFGILTDLVKKREIAMVVATHNFNLSKKMNRVIHLHRGHITSV